MAGVTAPASSEPRAEQPKNSTASAPQGPTAPAITTESAPDGSVKPAGLQDEPSQIAQQQQQQQQQHQQLQMQPQMADHMHMQQQQQQHMHMMPGSDPHGNVFFATGNGFVPHYFYDYSGGGAPVVGLVPEGMEGHQSQMYAPHAFQFQPPIFPPPVPPPPADPSKLAALPDQQGGSGSSAAASGGPVAPHPVLPGQPLPAGAHPHLAHMVPGVPPNGVMPGQGMGPGGGPGSGMGPHMAMGRGGSMHGHAMPMHMHHGRGGMAPGPVGGRGRGDLGRGGRGWGPGGPGPMDKGRGGRVGRGGRGMFPGHGMGGPILMGGPGVPGVAGRGNGLQQGNGAHEAANEQNRGPRTARGRAKLGPPGGPPGSAAPAGAPGGPAGESAGAPLLAPGGSEDGDGVNGVGSYAAAAMGAPVPPGAPGSGAPGAPWSLVQGIEEINRAEFPVTYPSAKFFVIKSYSEDDVHKSIKYGAWASTPNGNKRLHGSFQEAAAKAAAEGNQCPVFLFFSVNASGQFCGVAEMTTPVDFQRSVGFWQQDKWTGLFSVRWHIIKDVPNAHFRHILIAANDNKPVTNSRDTQEVPHDQGQEMLRILKSYMSRTSILDDFDFYDKRQKAMQARKERLQQQHHHQQQQQQQHPHHMHPHQLPNHHQQRHHQQHQHQQHQQHILAFPPLQHQHPQHQQHQQQQQQHGYNRGVMNRVPQRPMMGVQQSNQAGPAGTAASPPPSTSAAATAAAATAAATAAVAAAVGVVSASPTPPQAGFESVGEPDKSEGAAPEEGEAAGTAEAAAAAALSEVTDSLGTLKVAGGDTAAAGAAGSEAAVPAPAAAGTGSGV